MKKYISFALLFLLAASPVAAGGLPTIRTNVQGEVKVDAQVKERLSDRASDRLMDFSARLHRLEVRIEALIKRLKAKNVDVDTSEKLFAEFKAKLEVSDKSLAALSAYLNAGVTVRDSAELAAKRKAARQDLQAAHAALKATISEIAKSVRSIKHDNKTDVKVNASVNANVNASAGNN